MSVFMYPIYQSQCFTDKICCLKKYLIGQERRSIRSFRVNKQKKTPVTITITGVYIFRNNLNYFFIASSIATATATVAPTIGLLPIPRNPIIST